MTDDLFRYVPQIEQLLTPGQTIDERTILMLAERDRQLEDYLANCPCGDGGGLVVGGTGTGLPIVTGATAAAISHTTAAFTPGSGAIVFAFAAWFQEAPASIADSDGGTWTLIDSEPLDSGGEYCALWAKQAPASPVSQTITFTPPSSQQMLWIIMEVPGGSAIPQYGSAYEFASAAALTVTLASAFEKATNLAVGFCVGYRGSGAWTVGTGFTSLGTATVTIAGNDYHLLLESKENDNTIDATYPHVNKYKAIIGVEVRR